MLVLALKPGEGIVLGDLVHIRVIRDGGHTRLSIDAPKEVKILRDTLPEGRRLEREIRRRREAASRRVREGAA